LVVYSIYHLLDEIEEKLNEEVNTTENEESGAMIIKIKNTSNMKVIKVIIDKYNYLSILRNNCPKEDIIKISKKLKMKSIQLSKHTSRKSLLSIMFKKKFLTFISEETKEEYELLVSNLFKVD